MRRFKNLHPGNDGSENFSLQFQIASHVLIDSNQIYFMIYIIFEQKKFLYPGFDTIWKCVFWFKKN